MCGFVFSSAKEMSETFKKSYDSTFHRGPDHQSITADDGGIWGFHRLSIMDMTNNGNQPFVHNDVKLMCNGEIYNFEYLTEILKDTYNFHSHSDCEVLIPICHCDVRSQNR